MKHCFCTGDAGNKNCHAQTPVVISRRSVIQASQKMAHLDELRENLAENLLHSVGDDDNVRQRQHQELWDASNCWDCKVQFLSSDNSIVPDEIVINAEKHSATPSSLAAVTFLPRHALMEFLASPALLDGAILNYLFLETISLPG